MDNNFQKIPRLSGWTRCLLIAYITMMYMSLLHANIATTQHVGTAKRRPAGATPWRPPTPKCQRVDFTTKSPEAPRPRAELRAPRVDLADRKPSKPPRGWLSDVQNGPPKRKKLE